MNDVGFNGLVQGSQLKLQLHGTLFLLKKNFLK